MGLRRGTRGAGAITTTLTLGTLSPSAAFVAQPYGGTASVSGGVAPYTMAINSNDLPADGLSVALNGSTISIAGTPGATGTFSVNLTISDNSSQAVTQDYSVTVEQTAVTVGSITAPTGDTGGTTYSDSLPIQGGTGPYTLTDTTGLPPGLSASLVSGNSILISGQPTTLGLYPNVSLTVTDSLGEMGTVTGTITIISPPSLGSSLSPASWTVNEPNYSGTTSINVGSAPFDFMASGLPPGLSAALNGTDDEVLVTGTPTSTGTFSNVSFTITDAWGATDNKRYTIAINPAPSLGSLSLSSWTVNQAGYSGSIPIVGGTGPFTLHAQSGLPPGLRLPH